jgi:hypothetical protein
MARMMRSSSTAPLRQSRVSTVVPDGNPVGYLRDLVELVGDQDRGDALRLEAQQKLQQGFAVRLAEARGRLIEDQQLDLLGERLGDLHELLLADTEMGDEGVGALIEAHHRHQLTRPGGNPAPVDDPEAGRLVAEEDVLGDRQIGDQGQFLVDDDDSEALAVGDVPELAGPALIGDAARVGSVGIDAAQNLHQRRFPGTVLANEGEDLGGLDGEVDVVEGLHAGEGLGDPPHFEDGLHATPTSSDCTFGPRAGSCGARMGIAGAGGLRPDFDHLSWSRV